MIRIFKLSVNPLTVPQFGTGTGIQGEQPLQPLVEAADADVVKALELAGEQLRQSSPRSGEALGIFMDRSDLDRHLGQLQRQSRSEFPPAPRVPHLEPPQTGLPPSILANQSMRGEQWIEHMPMQVVIYRIRFKDDPDDPATENSVDLLRANAETVSTAGMPLEKLLNEPFHGFVREDHLPRMEELIIKSFFQREGALLNVPLLTVRDGQPEYAWSDVYVRMPPEGKEGVAFVVDQTERYHTTQALERANAELVRYREYIINGPPGSFIELDDKSHLQVKLNSKSLAALLGYTLDELNRLNIKKDLLAEESHPVFDQMLQRFADLNRQGDESAGSHFKCTLQMRHKDGTDFSVDFHATVGSVDGKVFVQATYKDARPRIDQERFEQQREQIRKEQEKLRQEREAATRLAHTVANSVQTVAMNIELASRKLAGLLEQRHKMDAELVQTIEGIKQASDNAQTLAIQTGQELLTFINWQTGVRQIAIVPLHSIIDPDKIEAQVAAKGIKSFFRLEAAPNSIAVDPKMLQGVFAILIENAVEAMQNSAEKTLTISTANLFLNDAAIKGLKKHLVMANGDNLTPGDYVMMSFQDAGEGIASSQLPLIFRSGQGLVKVQSLINEVNGAIGVSSKQGKGTTFVVYLPRVAGTSDSYRGKSFG